MQKHDLDLTPTRTDCKSVTHLSLICSRAQQ
uniref:Uncharacterized protein n=1 Tax=Arundo donax TaxID=35708 RepID=A0A0A9AQV4_ARUDO